MIAYILDKMPEMLVHVVFSTRTFLFVDAAKIFMIRLLGVSVFIVRFRQ